MLGTAELAIILIIMLGNVIWIWSLVEVLRNEPDEGYYKAKWVIFIALTHVVGALIYLTYRYRSRLGLLRASSLFNDEQSVDREHSHRHPR
jgi:hypothetical protein